MTFPPTERRRGSSEYSQKDTEIVYPGVLFHQNLLKRVLFGERENARVQVEVPVRGPAKIGVAEALNG